MSHPTPKKWTLESALAFIRKISPVVQGMAGFDLALAGSVLKKGESSNDLDLICFPLNASEVSRARLFNALMHCGLKRKWEPWEVQKFWCQQHSNDLKSVEVWFTEENQRVDFFLLR